jgi:hypothetical protein
MRTPTPTDISGRLASAIESGDFEAAQPLIAEYGNVMQAQLRAASPADRQRVYDRALETLNEHLRVARMARSHIYARVRQLSGQSLYTSQREHLHTWRVEG